MAESGSFLREQFVCSICLEIFSRPVTLPCGHNFCCDCITQAWDVAGKSCCPLCKENFTMRPQLRTNSILSETAAALKARNLRKEAETNQTGEQPSGRRGTQEHVKCQRHLQEQRCTKPPCQLCAETDHDCDAAVSELNEQRAALHQSVCSELGRRMEAAQWKRICLEENLSSLCEEATSQTDTSVRLFSTFTCTAQGILSALLEDIESRQRAAEQKVKRALEQVKEEMASLNKTKTDLEGLGWTEDLTDVQEMFDRLDSDQRVERAEEIIIQGSLEGLVRSAVERLHTELSADLQKLSLAELRSVQKYAVDVSLDPDTAHSALLLSDDGRAVHCGDSRRNLPFSASRFTDSPCVLSRPLRQHAAKLYYEVQVKDKTRWYLGVAKESIERHGQVSTGPSAGLWVIWLKGEQMYRALDEPAVLLVMGSTLERVGVFVDRSEGLVRFYNADSAERLYTFTGCGFTEALRAFFGPCSSDGGSNMAPLVITDTRSLTYTVDRSKLRMDLTCRHQKDN